MDPTSITEATQALLDAESNAKILAAVIAISWPAMAFVIIRMWKAYQDLVATTMASNNKMGVLLATLQQVLTTHQEHHGRLGPMLERLEQVLRDHDNAKH